MEAKNRALNLVAGPQWEGDARGANCETGHPGRFVLIPPLGEQAGGGRPSFLHYFLNILWPVKNCHIGFEQSLIIRAMANASREKEVVRATDKYKSMKI